MTYPKRSARACGIFRGSALYGLFFGGFYALGGWFLFWILSAYNMPFLVYPLASGFALIAPFVAAGLYEVSRRREEGLDITPAQIFGAIFGERSKELRWMALITGFAFIIWIDIAIFLYVIFFGLHPVNPAALLNTILLTPQGAMFLLAGNLIGAMLSLAVFSITAISFPMLMHKDVDFITAMITSIKCVLSNKKVMISWGHLHRLLDDDLSGLVPARSGGYPAIARSCHLASLSACRPF